jgi:erythromycin esterase
MIRKIFILFLVCFVSKFFCQAPTAIDKKKLQEIKKASYPLKDFTIKDTSFSDLKFLDKLLANKNIFLISDGRQAGSNKTDIGRIIKYLHEKHGFDLLIVESGFYNTEKMYTQLSRTPKHYDTLSKYGLVNFIGTCKENYPLFEYIANKSNSKQPLKLAGFDISFNSGDYAHKYLLHEIDSILEVRESVILNSTRYQKFKIGLDSLFLGLGGKLNKEYKAFLASYSDTLFTELKGLDDVGSYWPLILENLNAYIKANTPGKEIPDELSKNTLILKNFNWLFNAKSKNQKFIVWAPTNHLCKCSFPECNKTINTLGDYIYNVMGTDKIFYLNCMNYITNNTTKGNADDLPFIINATEVKHGIFMLNKKEKVLKELGVKINYPHFFDAVLYHENVNTCNWVR